MPIHKGANILSGVYKGSTPLSVYQGTTKLWPSNPATWIAQNSAWSANSVQNFFATPSVSFDPAQNDIIIVTWTIFANGTTGLNVTNWQWNGVPADGSQNCYRGDNGGNNRDMISGFAYWKTSNVPQAGGTFSWNYNGVQTSMRSTFHVIRYADQDAPLDTARITSTGAATVSNGYLLNLTGDNDAEAAMLGQYSYWDGAAPSNPTNLSPAFMFQKPDNGVDTGVSRTWGMIINSGEATAANQPMSFNCNGGGTIDHLGFWMAPLNNQ